MDVEADKDLLYIAREGLKAPLPPDWKLCRQPTRRKTHFNFQTGESTWDHPCWTTTIRNRWVHEWRVRGIGVKTSPAYSVRRRPSGVESPQTGPLPRLTMPTADGSAMQSAKS